jgi:hypothetical protein
LALFDLSTLEPQATEFSEMIVPNWGLLAACASIAPKITMAASMNGFFISAPRCQVLASRPSL